MDLSPEILLSYPFNEKEIFTKRKSLKRQLLNELALKTSKKKLKIAILGGATTFDLIQVSELMFLNAGFEVEFYESSYNAYSDEVLFSSGALWEFKPNVIYIHTSFRNLNFSKNVNDVYDNFVKIWETIEKNSNAIVIQNNFELPALRALGNLEATDANGKTKYINFLNEKFSAHAGSKVGFYINDINYISTFFGLNKWFDATSWNNYKLAYSSEATLYVAKSFYAIVSAIQGKSKKCLVLDLDNTLWGGVIGDDGLSGIALGEGDPTGEAFLEFQKYIKELKARGVMLAVCSKNDLTIAKNAFTHPDAILKIDDFLSFQASWGMKTEGLKKIAQELNIGLDSLVFIDDNPAERELIRKQLPMVAVPEIGNDVTEYARHIEHNCYFESLKILEEDLKKNSYYTDNKLREENKAQFENYSDFLKTLAMKAEIKPFSKFYLHRIAQLINKTNQFNLTTKRMDAEEVEKLLHSDSHISLYARLTDTFGDNGLVSLMTGTIINDSIQIDVWIMSCRVFKRDLEYALFDEFVINCINKKIKSIKGQYVRSEKNDIVSQLYFDLGFERLSDTEWILPDVRAYKPRNNVIEIKEII